MTITRRDFQRAIEAGFEKIAATDPRPVGLSESSVAALRDVGHAATISAWRRFNNCPMTQAGLYNHDDGFTDDVESSWTWVRGFDGHITGLSNNRWADTELEIVDDA